MVKVKTLKAHRNEFGEQQEKAIDAEYQVPEDQAEMLVGAKLVERVAPKEPVKTGGV